MFWIVAILAVGTVIGLVIFAFKKLADRNQTKKPRLKTSIMLGLVAVIAGLVCFLVIPTMIKDSQWEAKQQTCAEEAGYDSPADDNNPALTTPMSQKIYRDCTTR